MNEEIRLAMEKAENCHQQRRLSRNTLAREQTNINLIGGLSPYVISKTSIYSHDESSNTEVSDLSETIYLFDQNDDIDFDLIVQEDYIENTAVEDSDADDPNENFILANESFASNEKYSLPLHAYTNVSTSEFCAALLWKFRQANICKSTSTSILELINLALPQPNNLPTSIHAVMRHLQGRFLLI